MKISVEILLFVALNFCACSRQDYTAANPNSQLEIDVINYALPILIPKKISCELIPNEKESNEDFEKRLLVFNAEMDSAEKKIEIVDHLEKLDSGYIEAYKTLSIYDRIPYLINSQRINRRIDNSQIELKGIELIFVDSTELKPDVKDYCHCLGQLTLSRVGFNRDSTKAAFKYSVSKNAGYYYDSNDTGILALELVDGNWEIINK
jgi:hypothetical protein